MGTGIVYFNWDNIEQYTDEEITYFLHLEGKHNEAICKIRNIDNLTLQNHILRGKIKYRFLVKSNNINELFEAISRAGKEDKISVLNSLEIDNKNKLIDYIKSNYIDLGFKEKEVAVWIIGELLDNNSLDILTKATVHKSVGIRRMAVSAMGKLNDYKYEDVLMRALDDNNPQVVLYAIKALKKLNSKKALEKIKIVSAKHNKDYIIREAKEFCNDDSAN